MPPRCLCLIVIACTATLGAAVPATAEEGFFDRLLGGTPGGAPANPFASNYPSAPPSPAQVRAARTDRAVRRSRERDEGPVPPGRIPQE
ncbi:hypothetical protein QO016_001396 [Methylobacterium persicinum]|uniref:Uncharacterized protein n=1 Tax=Methylobacterium persicinum TaxID=374426 RepID=A0ABU0HJA2_9HYPH|nr:hypothetical protein [Methylobacterium persicinum]GJE39145.1 hypothetical protein KHHGKMAE_3224 [Methylobacterium persicinum]